MCVCVCVFVQLIGWGPPTIIESDLLDLKSTDLGANFIQNRLHRNIQYNVSPDI